MTAGQRFVRLVTDLVVRWPASWRFLRGPLRLQFDRLAPVWDAQRDPQAFEPLRAALERLPAPPRRALDLGTGTGAIARIIAERFPEAEVTGADISERMLEEARRRTPAPRPRYDAADAQRLPYEDGSFDLVTLGNSIPFFDELARVTSAGGHVVFAFSSGPRTPIYVPPERLRRELGRRGFAEFAEVSAGRGSAVVASKG